MHISWLGQTAIRLQTKYLDEDVVLVIDAYKPATGDFPRSLSPNIALFSRGLDGSVVATGQKPFILDTLGECEIKEVMITSYPGEGSGLIFKINAEQMNLLHLGALHKKPDIAELEKIGAIDILFVPVGGGEHSLSAEDASDLVTELEPRLVIPIGYHCDSDPKAKPVANFIKELGIKPDTTDKKIIIKKKDLPAEDMKLVVLEKNI
ncbi:MAG: MBL fold metallo-hydrolase [Candidatus Magasanikbacteria bacterium]|nr:MBL fold metallo-hydrolase [Candidatus Magasanikbacteria bacterium]